MNKIRIGFKTKLFAFIGMAIIIMGLGFQTAKTINSWYDTHYFQFNRIITVILKKPVEIKERKLEVTQIVNIVEQIPELEDLTPIEEYICEKWGVYHCQTALAVSRAESGMREDAFNINSNNTIDVGIFQINSVHFKKEGCSLKDLVDQYKNVDCAYEIYEDSGWGAWVSYTNSSFTQHLDE